jgi:hypothetical protein
MMISTFRWLRMMPDMLGNVAEKMSCVSCMVEMGIT